MKYIAHRGLLTGPDRSKENTVKQIDLALTKGYDCEVDVWFQNDKWYLGHDGPEHKIGIDYLVENRLRFWIHAKNSAALFELSKLNYMHYFWHDTDDYTITSLGMIWVYPGKELSKYSICVLPERNIPNIQDARNLNCYGICSDYVETINT